jgi:hypothetical protein
MPCNPRRAKVFKLVYLDSYHLNIRKEDEQPETLMHLVVISATLQGQ